MTTLTGERFDNPKAQRERLDALRQRMAQTRETHKRALRAHQHAQESGDDQAEEGAYAELVTAIQQRDNARELYMRALSAADRAADQLGVTLANSIEAQDALKRIASSSAPLQGYTRIGDFMTADELCGMTGRALAVAGIVTVPNVGTDLGGQYVGQVTTPQVSLALLAFFQSVVMRERKASWMQRQGGVAQAAVQAPGAVKAAANITYTAEEAEAVTIASWIKAARQDIDDIASLQSDLAQTLSYGVLAVVEQELVAAILASPGIGAPDVSADTNTPDKVLTAVGLLTATGVQPNFVALNPVDATAAFKEREGTDGAYLTGSPWDRLPPIVQSAALTPGTCLVGDSVIGAKIGIRSGVSVSIGQEQDDMTRNMVTTLSECRVAPMVYVPAAFSSFALTPVGP